MRGIGVPGPENEEVQQVQWTRSGEESQRHSPTQTGPWQIPPTPTSFSQVSVGFAGAVLLLDAIRHKH